MSDNGPFVIVVAGVTEKVGKSMVADNLAVYLKAFNEDLPVTIFSCENRPGLDAMFSLGDDSAGTVADLFATGELSAVSGMGQFGVCYLSSRGVLPQPDDPARLRRVLSLTNDAEVVIIDAGKEMGGLWRNAVWAADLILLPVADHQSLPHLSLLRSELIKGGGAAEMLWLLPSRLGEVTDPAVQVDSHQLLRFSADERGCQVLELELSEDQRVHLQATGQDRPVLTRLPGSYVHDELRHLAEFVIDKINEGPIVECRSRRMLNDGLLPQRARRVDMVCPLCKQSAVAQNVHYLEALPSRYRTLLHEACLELLLEGTSLHAFLPLPGQLLIRTGVEGRGLRNEIRLLLLDAAGEVVEQQQFCPEIDSGWDLLLRMATGRGLNEQFPGLLSVSVKGDAATLLGPDRYRQYVRQRRHAFRKLRHGDEI